ncbi:DUF4145 domain-containing protein [Asaia siamensis]
MSINPMGSAALRDQEIAQAIASGRPVLCASAICRNGTCHGPISFAFIASDAMIHRSLAYAGLFDGTATDVPDITLTNGIDIIAMWPEEPRPNAPMYLPPNIEKAFLEAEECRLSRTVTAANMMFRRSLELATKDKGRDLDQTGNLAQRIRILSDAGRLTPEIRDWATHIRLIGNEAAHDEETPTVESVEALANLTRMTLVYLYEMPERVRLLRETSESEGA